MLKSKPHCTAFTGFGGRTEGNIKRDYREERGTESTDEEEGNTEKQGEESLYCQERDHVQDSALEIRGLKTQVSINAARC